MGDYGWIIAIACGLALVIGVLVWRPMRSALRDAQLSNARKDFHIQREHIEARFFQLAANSGKPRGLIWTGCDFEDDVIYVRNRRSGELSAFVGVTISFEAVQGGPMEGVEAVGNLRAATAVFRVDQGRWGTDGRALFNLNPTEAIRYFQDNLEMVGQEIAKA